MSDEVIIAGLRPRAVGDHDYDYLRPLLEDVRRMADGVGAIRELAITLAASPAPAPRPAPAPLTEVDVLLLTAQYRQCCAEGRQSAYITRALLRRVIEAAGGEVVPE
jgi:hypothetical protein